MPAYGRDVKGRKIYGKLGVIPQSDRDIWVIRVSSSSQMPAPLRASRGTVAIAQCLEL